MVVNQWWNIPRVYNRLRRWAYAHLPSAWQLIISEEGTGYCDRSNKVIQANPNLFTHITPKQQYRATQGILAHEFFHMWDSDAYWGDAMLKVMTNTLEDERIERRGTQRHVHLKILLIWLGRFSITDPKDNRSSRPPRSKKERINSDVLAMCLLWRWYHRGITDENHRLFYWNDEEGVGKTEDECLAAMYKKVRASKDAIALWVDQVKPLVEAAWFGNTTQHANIYASKILDILDIDPQAKQQAVPGAGQLPSDMPETGVPIDPSDVIDVGIGGPPQIPAQPPVSLEYADPAQIEQKAIELNRKWVHQLVVRSQEPYAIPHRTRGKWSIKNHINRPHRPFNRKIKKIEQSSNFALGLGIDRSGSIGYRKMEEGVRLAMMQLYLAACKLKAPVSIGYTGGHPQCATLFPMTVSETDENKALIAGFQGTTTGQCFVAGMQSVGEELISMPQTVRVYIAITDGEPVGETVSQVVTEAERMRKAGVVTLGIYLDCNDPARLNHIAVIKAIFGTCIVTSAEGLGKEVVRVMRRLTNHD